MPTSLVAGGAGFIGSHLCAALLEKGERVLCVDNLSSGSRENIEPLLKHPSFSLIEHDVQHPLRIPEPVDAIYHLASRASPVDFTAHALDILSTNSTGTRNLLTLAQEKRARFLYASTSEVYGEPAVSPQPETYWGNVNPNGARSCYDEAKRFGEALCTAFHRTHSVDVRIARFFNTYGPNMRLDDGRVIPNFITQALRGRPLTIYGTGKQTRSLCYVSDLVSGILTVMHRAKPGSVTNLGNDHELTMLDLANAVIAATGSRSTLSHLPPLPDDPTKRKPDLTRARALGWEPHVSLDEGLEATISFFRSRMEQ